MLVLIIKSTTDTYRVDVSCVVFLSHITTLGTASSVEKIEIHTSTVTILQSIISTLKKVLELYVDQTPLRSSKHFQRDVRDLSSIFSLLMIKHENRYEEIVRYT